MCLFMVSLVACQASSVKMLDVSRLVFGCQTKDHEAPGHGGERRVSDLGARYRWQNMVTLAQDPHPPTDGRRAQTDKEWLDLGRTRFGWMWRGGRLQSSGRLAPDRWLAVPVVPVAPIAPVRGALDSWNSFSLGQGIIAGTLATLHSTREGQIGARGNKG